MDINELENMMRHGKFNEVEKLLSEYINSNKEAFEKNFSLQLIAAEVKFQLGEFEKADKLIEQILSNTTEEQPLIRLKAYTTFADITWRQGKLDECENYIQQGESLLQYLIRENPKVIKAEAALLHRKGSLFWSRGKLNKALNTLDNSLKLRSLLEDQYLIAISKNNIGHVYMEQGNIKRALENHQATLEIFREEGNFTLQAFSLINLGIIESARRNYDTALEYFREGLDYFNDLGNHVYTAWGLYYTIISLIQWDKELIEPYLDKLEKINNETENEIVEQRFLIAKSMMLKSSNRPAKKFKAMSIFEKVVNDKIIEQNLTITAMIGLLELLIYELKISDEENILDQAKELLEKLTDIAREQQSMSILAQTFYLRSKFELLNLNPEKAKDLLNQAEILSLENGLVNQAIKYSEEQDTLIEDLENWKQLATQQASIDDRLELIKFDDINVREIYADSSEIDPEIPILFVVMKEGGNSLYNKNFATEDLRSEELLGNVVYAVNTMLSEIFEDIGKIERIKFKRYMLIFTQIGSVICCYVFKGKSFHAMNKMKEFVEQFENNQVLVDEILGKKTYVSNQTLNTMDNLVKSIFKTK